MTKKQMIAEFEKRMRYLYEMQMKYEARACKAEEQREAQTLMLAAQYCKGKSVAYEEAIKVVMGTA